MSENTPSMDFYPDIEGIEADRKASLVSEWIRDNNARYGLYRVRDLAADLRETLKQIKTKYANADEEDRINIRDLTAKALEIGLQNWKDSWVFHPVLHSFEVQLVSDESHITFEFNAALSALFEGQPVPIDACTKYPLAPVEYEKWVKSKIEAEA